MKIRLWGKDKKFESGFQTNWTEMKAFLLIDIPIAPRYLFEKVKASVKGGISLVILE